MCVTSTWAQAPGKPGTGRVKQAGGINAGPGPWSDPADETVWPNQTSRANSDPWLAEHHDALSKMNPRVLLVNFSNEHTSAQLQKLAGGIIDALAESSRYHGYKNPPAPVFLEYEVFKLVDLRDADRATGDSRRIPVKDVGSTSGFNMDYKAFFGQEFAKHYSVPNPSDAGRFLTLEELVKAGYVHEVWVFVSGNKNDDDPNVGAFEVVEEKPVYDPTFRKVVPERFVQAGNGGDRDQPWTGRSVRIGCINASRGVGCFLESLAHGVEGNSYAQAIPYFTRYFREYAGLDLNERLGLPFESLYAVNYNEQLIRYPDANTMIVPHRGKDVVVSDYVVFGGNAHFPPSARGHYDLNNEQPVMSTIEDWRTGSGPGGKDLARPWTNESIRVYRELATDCMGPWLVYWRQNMPGLGNQQKDDEGKPMKNWWPFLFY